MPAKEVSKEVRAQYDRNAKWDKANTTQIKMKLCNSTDADIISYLNSLPNKQGYLKSLIRADMARQQSPPD